MKPEASFSVIRDDHQDDHRRRRRDSHVADSGDSDEMSFLLLSIVSRLIIQADDDPNTKQSLVLSKA